MDKYGVTDGVQYVDTTEATLFDGHFLLNRSTLDICVLGYIGIVQHNEHSPEVLSISPGTSCISWGGRKDKVQSLACPRANVSGVRTCDDSVDHPIGSVTLRTFICCKQADVM